MNNEILRNKKLYKIFIVIIKYIPTILSVIHMLAILLNFKGISTILLSYVGGTSFTFIGLLFIMSYIFKFCNLYRIPLVYLFVVDTIGTLRVFKLIPLSLIDLYRTYTVISGIVILLFIYFMYKERNKPKIDYIQELYNRYCNC